MVSNPELFEKVTNFLGQNIMNWNYERTMEELVKVGEEILAENVTMAEKHAEKDIVLSDYLKTLEQQREQITRLQVEVEVLTQNNSLYRQKVNDLRAKTGYKVYEENLALAQQVAWYEEMLKLNVKPVSNCPKCRTAGMVVDQQKVFVKMECPCCKETWKTLGKA